MHMLRSNVVHFLKKKNVVYQNFFWIIFSVDADCIEICLEILAERVNKNNNVKCNHFHPSENGSFSLY